MPEQEFKLNCGYCKDYITFTVETDSWEPTVEDAAWVLTASLNEWVANGISAMPGEGPLYLCRVGANGGEVHDVAEENVVLYNRIVEETV